MTPIRERKDARVERDEARAQLLGTVGDVRKATAPSALVELVKGAAKARAIQIAVGSLVSARKRPVAFAGVAIVSALFAFRKPLAAAIKRRFKTEKNDERPD